MPSRTAILCTISVIFLTATLTAAEPDIPRFEKHGTATRLIVHGKPFLMISGETHNSSASTLEYMAAVWQKLKTLNLNSVLMPIAWEQFEPEEGKFDYTLVDGLIAQAREHDMKIVFLWFASWKNGVSSYAPAWVKRDTARFPRAQGSSNRNTKDILSTLSGENRSADARAFAALMRRIREIDAKENTVIMMQIENEIGIKPELRDMSEASDRAYAGQVPAELMTYLAENRETLHPELLARWEKGGFRASGTWAEVFGGYPGADEVYSVWHYARYVQHIAAAGKQEYPLPMFVNAWLPAPDGRLGNYPCGGPVAHMLDVWRAAAPDVDAYAPDIYLPDFKGITAEFTRGGNPLLIPEAHRGDDAPARAYWTFGKHHGLCFAPFGIESMPETHPLAEAYALLNQAMPVIGAAQGTDRMTAVYRADGEKDEETAVVGDWNIIVKYTGAGVGHSGKPGAIIIQTAEEEFILIGQGVDIGFGSRVPGLRNTAILSVEMGRFENGVFHTELFLNGDETGANYRAKLPPNTSNQFLTPAKPRILRVKVYRHD